MNPLANRITRFFPSYYSLFYFYYYMTHLTIITNKLSTTTAQKSEELKTGNNK